jgi:hypothetical protein
MTFEQLFSGRLLLMRAQRHICQAGIARYATNKIGTYNWLTPEFRTAADEQAYFTAERLLMELELEFDEKKKRCDRRKQQRLDRRADRQVRKTA